MGSQENAEYASGAMQSYLAATGKRIRRLLVRGPLAIN